MKYTCGFFSVSCKVLDLVASGSNGQNTSYTPLRKSMLPFVIEFGDLKLEVIFKTLYPNLTQFLSHLKYSFFSIVMLLNNNHITMHRYFR